MAVGGTCSLDTEGGRRRRKGIRRRRVGGLGKTRRTEKLGNGERTYRKIPNNSRAFICFNHLTDQAFIWDRRLIPSSQKSGMKMSQTSPASL